MIYVVCGYCANRSHSTSCAKLPRSAPETLARAPRESGRPSNGGRGWSGGGGGRGPRGGKRGQTGAALGAGRMTHSAHLIATDLQQRPLLLSFPTPHSRFSPWQRSRLASPSPAYASRPRLPLSRSPLSLGLATQKRPHPYEWSPLCGLCLCPT
jgi:hypothetical protein